MYPCPCCGYKTLPERGGYDLCPVCWWEDDGGAPWEYCGPNAQTLVEAQQEYLAQHRPYRLRPGKVRAPRQKEARDADWQPCALTDELLERVERANAVGRRFWEAEERRMAQETADDPEGAFKEYNAAIASLRAEAPTLSHRELKAKLRELIRAHGLPFSNAHLELLSRQMKDEDFYRGCPGSRGT